MSAEISGSDTGGSLEEIPQEISERYLAGFSKEIHGRTPGRTS